MTETPQECRALGRAARDQAASAGLANVAARHIAAAEAWELLATRTQRMTEANAARRGLAIRDTALNQRV